jgi:hypothetical protein
VQQPRDPDHTSRPTVLLSAFGDNNMRTVVMIVVRLIAIAI